MNTQVIVTLSGPDKAGILAKLAERTHSLHGKWLDSRINQMDGQLAGLIKIELPKQNLPALKDSFAQQLDLTATFAIPDVNAHHEHLVNLVYHCTDKPGIVNDVSHALNDMDIYIEKMECQRVGVQELGTTMFLAELQLMLPDNVTNQLVIERLYSLDADASIEIHD